MNQYIIIAVLLLIAFWMFLRRAGNTGGVRISPADAKQKLETENGTILLDVRTKEEYLGEHIPKSILIPLDVLAGEAGRKLPDKDAEIIVYCRSGSRSSVAVNKLTKLGYTRVYNLGGIIGWPYKTVSGNK